MSPNGDSSVAPAGDTTTSETSETNDQVWAAYLEHRAIMIRPTSLKVGTVLAVLILLFGIILLVLDGLPIIVSIVVLVLALVIWATLYAVGFTHAGKMNVEAIIVVISTICMLAHTGVNVTSNLTYGYEYHKKCMKHTNQSSPSESFEVDCTSKLRDTLWFEMFFWL